jgi:hypothetical protein
MPLQRVFQFVLFESDVALLAEILEVEEDTYLEIEALSHNLGDRENAEGCAEKISAIGNFLQQYRDQLRAMPREDSPDAS